MIVFKKKPFMYLLGARLFEWMRACDIYKLSKANGTLLDMSLLKGKKIEQECEDELK